MNYFVKLEITDASGNVYFRANVPTYKVVDLANALLNVFIGGNKNEE